MSSCRSHTLLPTKYGLKGGSCVLRDTTSVEPSSDRARLLIMGQMPSEPVRSTLPDGTPIPIMGDDKLMRQKAHGTSEIPCQENLRWECDWETADRICNYNRHYAEHRGYFEETAFLDEESKASGEIVFRDSNTGKPLFIGPKKRSWNAFIKESKAHGWPRDQEVVWENVRVLPNGETVSVDGTHLGHNLPDSKGNRYCINLVCVAGREPSEVGPAATAAATAAAPEEPKPSKGKKSESL